jgi:hypothetical protein
MKQHNLGRVRPAQMIDFGAGWFAFSVPQVKPKMPSVRVRTYRT